MHERSVYLSLEVGDEDNSIGAVPLLRQLHPQQITLLLLPCRILLPLIGDEGGAVLLLIVLRLPPDHSIVLLPDLEAPVLLVGTSDYSMRRIIIVYKIYKIVGD
jgi:hypothetical protein